MYSICGIDAVDSIKRRVVKFNLTPEEMADLMCELLDNGYEMENIQCTQRFIYEEGDNVCLKLSTVDKYRRKYRSSREKTMVIDAIRGLKYIFGDKLPYEMYGTVVHKRVNRIYGLPFIKWHNGNKDWRETNTDILKAFGYEFADPEIDRIPIDKASDDLLNDEERVLKYLMIDNKWTKKKAEEYMKVVYSAMNKAECVMYRP